MQAAVQPFCISIQTSTFSLYLQYLFSSHSYLTETSNPRVCPVAARARSPYLIRLEIVQPFTQSITSRLGVSEQHLGIRVVEERIRHFGITCKFSSER